MTARLPESWLPPETESSVGELDDRRNKKRREYPYTQRVAICPEGSLPTKPMFFDVVCYDLSPGGFSFQSNFIVTGHVVVALGRHPNIVYVKARVASCPILQDGPEPLYRIGCQFVSRVHIK